MLLLKVDNSWIAKDLMFKKVKIGQEAPFSGNSGELGLFSNGRADGNWRGIAFQMGGFNTTYGTS